MFIINSLYISLFCSKKVAERGGIRTPEGREPLLVFKTSAFNHSATSPDAMRQTETTDVHPYDNDIIELN